MNPMEHATRLRPVRISLAGWVGSMAVLMCLADCKQVGKTVLKAIEESAEQGVKSESEQLGKVITKHGRRDFLEPMAERTASPLERVRDHSFFDLRALSRLANSGDLVAKANWESVREQEFLVALRAVTPAAVPPPLVKEDAVHSLRVLSLLPTDGADYRLTFERPPSAAAEDEMRKLAARLGHTPGRRVGFAALREQTLSTILAEEGKLADTIVVIGHSTMEGSVVVLPDGGRVAVATLQEECTRVGVRCLVLTCDGSDFGIRGRVTASDAIAMWEYGLQEVGEGRARLLLHRRLVVVSGVGLTVGGSSLVLSGLSSKDRPETPPEVRDAARRKLAERPAEPTCEDLIGAAMTDKFNSIELYLDAGVDIEDEKCIERALMSAVSCGNVEATFTILQRRAVTVPVLSSALLKSWQEDLAGDDRRATMTLLVAAGAPWQTVRPPYTFDTNIFHLSFPHWVAYRGCNGIVKAIAQEEDQLRALASSFHGVSLLMVAVAGGDLATIRTLLSPEEVNAQSHVSDLDSIDARPYFGHP